MDQDCFEVEVAVLPSAKDFLFLAHFNVPGKSLQDGSFPSRLGTIRACVEEEFAVEIAKENVSFMVAATCTLVDAKTGKEMSWATQMMPAARFVPENFANESTAAVDSAVILRSLGWIVKERKWTMQRIKSSTFCFQARCRSAEHPFRPSRLVPQQQIAKLSRRGRGGEYKLNLDN